MAGRLSDTVMASCLGQFCPPRQGELWACGHIQGVPQTEIRECLSPGSCYTFVWVELEACAFWRHFFVSAFTISTLKERDGLYTMRESESLLNATRCIFSPRNLRNTRSTGGNVTEGRASVRGSDNWWGPGVQTAAVPRCTRLHLFFCEVLRRRRRGRFQMI